MMSIPFKPKHVKRYRDVARLFAKYGRGEIFGDEFARDPKAEKAKAEDLTADLEEMGPTYVKLGQLLSTRADLIPARYLEALTRLQDHVGPFSYEQVEAIVEVELGVRISHGFTFFDHEPMAAASLGQVHRAALRDGHKVVVKVQRPNIQQQMVEDLEALMEIAQFLDSHSDLGRYELGNLIGQFTKSLLSELDYEVEAENLTRLKANLASFERLVIPAPVLDYTTKRVLTMDFVEGTKITKLNPVVRTDFDGAVLAEELFHAYLKMILDDGFFHADPHPGNVLLTPDHRVALIDLGMVARVSPRMRGYLLQFLLAISEGRPDDAASLALKIGDRKEEFDELQFRRRITELVNQQQDADVRHIQMGSIVLTVTQVSADTGVRVPQELAMIGKTLMNLDLVGQALDADFDPNAAIRRHAAKIMRRRMMHSLSPGNLFSGMLESKDLLERLPERANKILDLLADNKLRMHVDAIDEAELIKGIQKVANRITAGLIVGALIVGAAMMMRVETEFTLLGYPGLAMIFFMIAFVTGLAIAFNILIHDRRK